MAKHDFTNAPHSSSALDFATRTVHAPASSSASDKADEVEQTIAELTQYFGKDAISAACVSLGITSSADQNNERTLQTLRAFAVLVIDSSRPKLTVQLIGKIAGLELASGRRIRLSDLAAANSISKQAVSRLMATYAERLNLPRPYSTPESRASHRAMNRRNYGHSTPTPATHAYNGNAAPSAP